MSTGTAPQGTRNGLPAAPGYVYRGKGYDILTGGMSPCRVREEIAEAEGEAYTPPLHATDIVPFEHAMSPEVLASRAARRRPRCGKPLTGTRRLGDYCGRAAGHGGGCASDPEERS